MSNHENCRDLPEFQIFLKFFEQIFGFSPETKKWKFDPGKIEIKDTLPLLMWPLILSIKFLCPTEEKEINKKLTELEEIINETDIDVHFEKIKEIFNLIKGDLSQDKYSDILESFDENDLFELNLNSFNRMGVNLNSIGTPKIGHKILFFLINLSLLDQELIRKLKIAIPYYLFVYFLFIKSLMVKEEETAIYQIDLFYYCSMLDEFFEDKVDTQTMIGFWIGIMGRTLFKEGFKFLSSDYKKFVKSANLSGEKLRIQYFYKENPNYYVFIIPGADNKAGYSITFKREINFLNNMDYYLEFDFFKENPDREIIIPVLTFKNKNNCDKKTDTEHLLVCLYLLSEKISTLALNVMDSRNEFIDNPTIRVRKDLDIFKERMKLAINSYSLFDEYVSQKDLSRAVETLDMEYDDGAIIKIRKEIKKAKKYHIPPELSEKLKEANKELGILFTSVRGIKDYKRDKEAIKYFNNHPHQFKLVQLDDIEDVLFTSEANAIRDARRKVLSRIANRCGKDLPPSRITKGLGLE